MSKLCIKEKWNEIPLTVKVSISYAICSILQKCLGLITLPLFTRLLTTEQYGQATIYSSWSGILTIFLTLELQYGSFSKAMVKYENRRDEYIACAQGICILLSCFFLTMYLPFRNLWNKLFELPTDIIVLMVFDIIAGAGIAFWSGKKRFEFRYKEVIVVTLAISIISPILQYFLVVNTDEKGYARIIGGAIVTIVFGGYIFISSLIKVKHIFNEEFWRYALGFNVPLLVYYLSQIIFNTSDRIMISHMAGKSKAAIYGVAYSLAIMLNFVLNAINNSYVPWFYGKLKNRKQDDNKQIANAISILMASLLLGVIWFSPEIIRILAGKAYTGAKWIVPPVAISTLLLFYSQLSINYEFYFESKKKLIKASICAAVTNIILNALMIPVFGYYAAGYTTLFSYLLFAGANYFAMKKIIKEKGIKTHGFDVKTLLIILSVFVALAFVGMFLYNYFIIRVCVVLIAAFVMALNYRQFVKYWRILKDEK